MRKRSRCSGVTFSRPGTRLSNRTSGSRWERRCHPISLSSGSSTLNSCANFRRYGTAHTAMTSSRSIPIFIGPPPAGRTAPLARDEDRRVDVVVVEADLLFGDAPAERLGRATLGELGVVDESDIAPRVRAHTILGEELRLRRGAHGAHLAVDGLERLHELAA